MESVPLPPILTLPSEVLEFIALELVLLNPVGPPRISAFAQTCKAVRRVLCPDNLSLYGRIFKTTFDTTAPARRYGPHILRSENLKSQLFHNWRALKHIRASDYRTLETDFWTCYLLLLEDDGKNCQQVLWAGVPDLADKFVRTGLHDGSVNWPADSTINSLALWIMWMTLDQAQLMDEPLDARQAIFDQLRPYVLLSCRYPSFVFPDNHFHVPLEDDEEPQFTHSLATAHGPWPSYRLPEEVERRPYHFGHQRSLSTPLLSTAARLIYFARREIIAMGIPPNLPLNRAAAGDQIIPTQEDIHEVNASTHAALPRRASSDWVHSLSDSEWHAEMRGVLDENVRAPSSRWDQDFARLHAFDPWDMPNIRGVPYRPGCMAGRWAGRMLIPQEISYMQMVTMPTRPADFGEMWPFSTTAPVFMDLAEWHCISPRHPAHIGGVGDNFDDGVRNGWFPEGTRFKETMRGLEVNDGTATTEYERWTPGQTNSHDEDTCRICAQRRRVYAGMDVDEEEEEYESGGEEEDQNMRSRTPVPPNFGLPPHIPTPTTTGTPPPPPSDPKLFDAASNVSDGEDEIESVPCRGIADIAITGDTQGRHGMAWHFYKYYGRVRQYDGLITLVREPRDRRQGRFIIRGYLVSETTFVGTWRPNTDDASQIPWEGPFIMSRQS